MEETRIKLLTSGRCFEVMVSDRFPGKNGIVGRGGSPGWVAEAACINSRTSYVICKFPRKKTGREGENYQLVSFIVYLIRIRGKKEKLVYLAIILGNSWVYTLFSFVFLSDFITSCISILF